MYIYIYEISKSVCSYENKSVSNVTVENEFVHTLLLCEQYIKYDWSKSMDPISKKCFDPPKMVSPTILHQSKRKY